jgi:uncharacterized membrane protein
MTPLGKRLAIALAISVAANLMFIGFLIGRRVRHHGPGGPALDGPAFNAESPRAWRHPGLHRAFEARHEEVRVQRESARKARDAVREALRREPFDRKGLEESLTALRAETAKNQELLHRALVQAAVESNESGRRDLARSFGHAPKAQ